MAPFVTVFGHRLPSYGLAAVAGFLLGLFFILLEGRLTYFLYDDNSPREMRPGDTLYMKANIPHRVQLCEGCTYAKGLVIYSDAAVTEL